MTISVNWDLETIFAGGSQSPALTEFLAQLATDFTTFEAQTLPEPLTEANQAPWVTSIQTLYDLGARVEQVSAFVECLVSQDVNDDPALQFEAQVDRFKARLKVLWTQFEACFSRQPQPAWDKLTTETELKAVAFHLNEARELARQKMEPAREALANELATDGYHAWDRLYGVVSGTKEVTFDGQRMSLGQLQNKFVDDPDRVIRQQAFELYEAAWGELAKPCALALNYQAGFRLTWYKHRQWQSVLHEPLMDNRLTPDTLEAMWSVVAAKSDTLLDYFAAKAKLFGVEKLSWFDVAAPVGHVTKQFTFEEAAHFVVDTICRLDPYIADYCRLALERHWIEAEDRSGKRAGAYCTSFPLSRETRLFMTYNGSYNGLLTLAHELGHGYHDWVMRDLPYGAREYSMSVAETASTFNELVVNDASLQAASDDQERLSLLASKLNDAASLLMNIRARFDFEVAFFEQRANHALSVDELSGLMLAAQKRAFHDGLAVYHPLFWASKLHFYITEAPFYNFPYTFGYLFSNGVYAQSLSEGPAFKDRYVALLRDTGSMTTEALAHTHLGVDLTKPAFWETAVDRVLADVDEFVALADKVSQ